MEKLEKLPEEWYCKVTEENKETLIAWKNSKCSANWKNHIPFIGNYVISKHPFDNSYYYGLGNIESDKRFKNYQEISFEDFKRLVLKESKFKIGDKVSKINDIIVDTRGLSYKHLYNGRKIEKIDEINQTFSLEGDCGEIWFYMKDFELAEIKEKKMEEKTTENQTIKISSDVLFTYFKAATAEQKEYLNKHFQLDGTTTVEAIKGLYDIACSDWKPKIKANHPDCFKEDKVWKRNMLNDYGKQYYYIFRDAIIGFKTESARDFTTNLNFTFSTKKEAENNVLLYKTMMLMRNWAKFHNELDGFKTNWNDGKPKYGIYLVNNRIDTVMLFDSNSFLFHAPVSSRKRVEEMLVEFEEDLKKLISLGVFI